MKKIDIETLLNLTHQNEFCSGENMLFQRNGQFIEKYEISVEDRAFMYGDGCFTTLRWASGNMVLWQRHIGRLTDAIDRLGLNCTAQQIEQQANQFIAYLSEQSFGTIKIVLSRGVSARGYALPDTPCDIYFYYYGAAQTTDIPTLSQIGLFDIQMGTSMSVLKGIKSLNRLEQVMLKSIAQNFHWQEGLCFDQRDHLVEAISSNCFVLIDHVWVTPNLELTGIAGTMRQEILDRLKHYQIEHQVRIISRAELAQAKAIFLCNALQPMQVVQSIVDTQGHIQILDSQPCHQLYHALSLFQLV